MKREHITTINQTQVFLNTYDLFKYGGDRKQKDLTEYRVGIFFRTLALVLILMPWVWLVYNSGFSVSEIVYPKDESLIFSFSSIWIYIYGLYLSRDKNEFDSKVEQKSILHLIKDIESGNKTTFELENAISVDVIQIFDEIYSKYKNQFIVALSDYMITVSPVRLILQSRLGVDINKLKQMNLEYFKTRTTSFEATFQEFFSDLLNKSILIRSDKITEELVLLTLVSLYWQDILKSFAITNVDIEGLILWLKNQKQQEFYLKKWERLSKLKPKGPVNRAFTSRATSVLDTFGSDYTALASNSGFTISIGRESEMNAILTILERSSNSAVLIIGEPGVGKTHFLKYLATRMVVEDVPKAIQDSRLVVIDLNKVFTKTGTLEEFKITIQSMLEEVVMSGNLIVVLEDFSQILSIRNEGKLEVVNTIVNMISQYKIKTIATTTRESYARYIKPIQSLAALFSPIELKEPSNNVSLQLLIDFAGGLESSYDVSVQLSALKRIVEYSNRFDYERVMPDKGFSLLEEAILEAKKKGLSVIDKSIVDEVLSAKVGVRVGDISSDESELLKNLEEEMHKSVVGQNEAIKAVSSAMRRARSGLHSGNKPLASFLFFGPTGVGKTEVAKTLTSTYYGDEKLMIRLDMSEYQEEVNLDRLIGYSDSSGNLIGGYLTEAVRQRPFSLVLLDELEKANPKVLDLFLQVLDEGRITDGIGRTIDFTNTIIIATSNAASKEIASLFDQSKSYEEVLSTVSTELRDYFRVEFLNRFDKVIMFRPLNKFSEVEEIVGIMLNKVKQRLVAQGMDLFWSELTISDLAQKGISKIYGARELKRVVQEEIEDKIAEEIVNKRLLPGLSVYFDGLTIKEIR